MKKTIIATALFVCAAPALAETATLSFIQQAAQDLRERARFPEWSQPVSAGALDPLLSDRTPTRQTLAGPQGAAPSLSVWASTISARAGESVDVFAELSGLQPDTSNVLEVLRASRLKYNAAITAELVNEAGARLVDIVYADDGKGADVAAGDGIYSGRVSLPAERAPALGSADSLMLKVTAALPNGEERKAVGGFQYSNPGAVLTGRYKDAIKQGNLVLQAEVEVLTAGRYHLTGTLATLTGTPVATAQAAQKYSAPGKYWMELPVYGLILRDAGVSGRLGLSSVALTSTNGMPNALGPVLRNVYQTQSINPLQLTALPFNNPDMIEAAKRLEASLLPALP
jgi:hypothetical protein